MKKCVNCGREVVYPCDTHCLQCKVFEINKGRRPNELPKMVFNGRTYYVDCRIGQIRNVDNPHDFVNSRELTEWFNELILMDIEKHNAIFAKL